MFKSLITASLVAQTTQVFSDHVPIILYTCHHTLRWRGCCTAHLPLLLVLLSSFLELVEGGGGDEADKENKEWWV